MSVPRPLALEDVYVPALMWLPFGAGELILGELLLNEIILDKLILDKLILFEFG